MQKRRCTHCGGTTSFPEVIRPGHKFTCDNCHMQFVFKEVSSGKFAISELGIVDSRARVPEPEVRNAQPKPKAVTPNTHGSESNTGILERVQAVLRSLSAESIIIIAWGIFLTGLFIVALSSSGQHQDSASLDVQGKDSIPPPPQKKKIPFIVTNEHGEQIYPAVKNPTAQETYLFYVATWCPASQKVIKEPLSLISKSYGDDNNCPNIVLIFDSNEWFVYQKKLYENYSASEVAKIIRDKKDRAKSIDRKLAVRYYDPKIIKEEVFSSNNMSIGYLQQSSLPNTYPSYYDSGAGKWYPYGSPKWSENMMKLMGKMVSEVYGREHIFKQ